MGRTGTRRQRGLAANGEATTGASKTIQKPRPSHRKHAKPKDVILQDRIPVVVRWAREQMDEYESSAIEEGSCSSDSKTDACNVRKLARRIMEKLNVRILLNGCTHWRGETRFWENVFALCAKLPSEGRGNNIFEAMLRYPSSILVCNGLKSIYGRHMVIAGEKIPRFALRQNAIALFSPNASEDTVAKKWFEVQTLSRMQEVVIHMCAISEYTLRCAYICKQWNGPRGRRGIKFLSLLEDRIRTDRDCRNRTILRFENWNAPSELSGEHLAPWLERSVRTAHDAVIEGAKAAARKYGRKEGFGKERGKIQLWMLRRPLPGVMDALVQGLESVIFELLEGDVDVDEFRLRAMRQLRIVESIYMDVGSIWFKKETDFKPPAQLPKNTGQLMSSCPYTLWSLR